MGRFKYNPGDAVGPFNNILIERLYKKPPRKWVCKFRCEKCENIFEALLSSVSNGEAHLCRECQKKVRQERCSKIGKQSYYKDYTFVENPFYSFIEGIKKYDLDGNQFWKIKCKKCGKEYNEIPSQVISEKRRRGKNPCPCWHKKTTSLGVKSIKEILKDKSISFIEEYKISDCKNPKTDSLLRFDFYLPDYNCCIEYDGEQHFKEVPIFQESLKEIQYRDNLKNEYCKNKNIKLIRIPYIDFKKISYKYLEERGCFNG